MKAKLVKQLPTPTGPQINAALDQLEKEAQALSGKKLITAGYIRTSARPLFHTDPPETHKAHILDYIQSQGWVLLDFLGDVHPATHATRHQEFHRLQQLVREERIQALVVARLDHLSSDLPTLLQFLALLKQHHIHLISFHEEIDSRELWGRSVLYLLGTLGELQGGSAGEEMRRRRLNDAVNGKLAPTYRFGYCKGDCSTCTDPNGPGYCPYAGGPDRRGQAFRIPHPIEAHAVELMFDWYITGELSFADIARRLNDQLYGLPDGQRVNFRTKGRPGLTAPQPFDADAVRHILSNPIYAGMVTYAGSTEEGVKIRKPRTLYPSQDHQALISWERFEQAQQCRQRRGGKPRQE